MVIAVTLSFGIVHNLLCNLVIVLFRYCAIFIMHYTRYGSLFNLSSHQVYTLIQLTFLYKLYISYNLDPAGAGIELLCHHDVTKFGKIFQSFGTPEARREPT